MLLMEKLCNGGQIFVKFPLAKQGNSLFLNLQGLRFKFCYGIHAMKAALVLPILLLQKPLSKSKVKEHNACMETFKNMAG